jgi:hypothetical protein
MHADDSNEDKTNQTFKRSYIINVLNLLYVHVAATRALLCTNKNYL